MKLYTIQTNERRRVAVQCKDNRLYPLDTLGFAFRDMNDLIKNISADELNELKAFALSGELPDSGSYAADEVKLCAPVPEPGQDIICLGVNYDEHIKETTHVEDFQNKEATVYFSKRANRAGGDGDIIPCYSFVDSLDYEAELGVIIGKTVKEYRKSDGYGCIFGYTVINDVSARNLQFKHKQWYMGKSLDGYATMGPCIVTADEIENVQNLSITCRVNGELRQNSNTKYMIQPVLDAVEELSLGITLKAGTIIATGTPGGVGLGMQPPQYLKSGDVIECYIEKIGSLTNIVA